MDQREWSVEGVPGVCKHPENSIPLSLTWKILFPLGNVGIRFLYIFHERWVFLCHLVSGKAQVAHGYWEMETRCAHESGF